MNIVHECPFCGAESKIAVDPVAYHRWKVVGDLVQNAFPDMSPEDREVLMTGICSACWKAMGD